MTRTVAALDTGAPRYLYFRRELEIAEQRAGGAPKRYTVYDPASDITFLLGEKELLVARMFDGESGLEEIRARLHQTYGLTVAPEKLAGFEKKLVKLGIVGEAGCMRQPAWRDPASGISYGPLKSMLMINIARFDPRTALEALVRRLPFVTSRAFVGVNAAFIVAALIVLGAFWDAFSLDVKTVYGHGLGWLAWHYPVIVLSILCHEFGHALACRAYGTRIREIGVAVYLLLATGWARPVQTEWAELTGRQRIVTIVMGPFVSLVFAAMGVFLWWAAPGGSWPAQIAVVVAVSSTAALIPTLMPFFNGDVYLALTEIFNEPGVRQRAFRYFKDALRGRPQGISLRRRLLYAAIVLGTLVGWAIAWYLIVLLLIAFLSLQA